MSLRSRVDSTAVLAWIRWCCVVAVVGGAAVLAVACGASSPADDGTPGAPTAVITSTVQVTAVITSTAQATVAPTDVSGEPPSTSACVRVPRIWTDRIIAVSGDPDAPQVFGQEGAPLPWPTEPAGQYDGDNRESKLHPVVQGWVASGPPDAVRSIVVTFDDAGYELPGLPDVPVPDGDGPAIAAQVQQCIDEIIDERSALLYDGFLSTHGAAMDQSAGVRRFWLTPALAFATRGSAIKDIAAYPGVLYVEPNPTGYGPPAARAGAGRVDAALPAAIAPADAMSAVGLTGRFAGVGTSRTLAMIDSGVDKTVTIGGAYDCVDNEACDGLFGRIDAWGHGTTTAQVLQAMGIASIRSFRVFGGAQATPVSGDSDDFADGIAGAVANGVNNAVILAQLQPEENPAVGAIAIEADHAFDQGRAVIAAAGNLVGRVNPVHGAGTYASLVAAPANAHKALAIGAYTLSDGKLIDTQRIGYAPDGRVKPDLLFPTDVDPGPSAEAAQGKTSGATTVAGAAAMRLMAWMEHEGRKKLPTYRVDPGELYAFMLNSGDEVYDPGRGEQGFSEFTGGGKMILPAAADFAWGRAIVPVPPVTSTGTSNVPVTISLTPTQASLVDATLWWPEPRGADHVDLDLTIVQGQAIAASKGCHTVFEHARGRAETGVPLSLTISGSPLREQVVYWAVSLRPNQPDAKLSPDDNKPTCTDRSPINDPPNTGPSDPPQEPSAPLPRPAAAGGVGTNSTCSATPTTGDYKVELRVWDGSTCTDDVRGMIELKPSTGYSFSFSEEGQPPLDLGDACIKVTGTGMSAAGKQIAPLTASTGNCFDVSSSP